MRGALRHSNCRWLEHPDVRRLQTLIALFDVEFDALAFCQGAVAVHLDRAVVDEHVATLRSFDEPVPLLVREPLHCALSQRTFPSFYTRTTARPRAVAS